MKAVMQYGSTKYVNAVYTKLGFTEQTAPAGFNESWEKAVLVSLAYNGMGAWPSALTSAITSGNRAEAWFQIRFASNYLGRKYSQGIALSTVRPRPTSKSEQELFDDGVDKGWAKRRYAESQLFDLYDNPSAVTPEESQQVYRMLQKHRKEILDYEKAYGLDTEGNSGTRGNQVAAAASDPSCAAVVGTAGLIASLAPALNAFITWANTQLPEGVAALNAADWNPAALFFQGADSSLDDGSFDPTLDARLLDGKGAGMEKNLMVGGTGGNIMYGGAGNDVLLGNKSADMLDGGAGNDYLEGGAGDDTYRAPRNGCRSLTMKKTKHRYPCPMCTCTQARALSDEAAVELHEFLEVLCANFLRCYGHRIYRHYAKRAKHQSNSEKPWEHPHPGGPF